MSLLDPLANPPLAARLRDVQSSPVREILALTARPGMISFAGGLPAPELFDAPGLRAAFAAALADDVAGRSLQCSTTEGDPALRARIADRLTARGLPTAADELLITSGSQQALTLIATVLLAGLADALPRGSTHNRPDGGMFVWARLPDGWDAAALLARALERGVAFVPGFPFFAGTPDHAALRLSFTAHARDRRGPAPAARRLEP